MSAPSDRPRPSRPATAGMAAAVALAWVNGLAVRHYQLGIGDEPYRGDYFTATGVCLGTAIVLVLGVGALAALRAPWWLWAGAGAAAGHHAVLAVSAYRLAGTTEPNPLFPPSGDIPGGVVAALMPGSWPLLVLVVAAAVALICAARARGPRPSGRVAIGGTSAAFVLAATTGPAAWYVDVRFFQMDGPAPADYQNAMLTSAATAALLLAGVLAVRVRWGTWYQLVPGGAGVLLQVVVVLGCLDGALGTPDPNGFSDLQIRFSLEAAALLPTTWPLLLVLAWVVVTSTRGRLRPTGAGAGRVEPWSHRPERPGAAVS